MSNLSGHIVGDIANLYSSINSKISEDEILEDICEVVLSSLICEGKTTNDIHDYLNNASVDDIIQLYENFDEKIITESVISEEFINEQLEQLDSDEVAGAIARLIDEGVGSALSALARPGFRFASGVLRTGKGLLGKGSGTVKQLNIPGTRKGALAVGNLKSKVGKVAKPVVQKAKKIGSRITGTGKGLLVQKGTGTKSGWRGALSNVGSGVVGGLIGANINRGGNKGSDTPAPTSKPAPAPASTSAPAPASTSAPRNKDGSTSTRVGKNEKGLTPKQQWAKNFPKLAAAESEKKRIRGTSQSDNPLITDRMRSRMLSGAPTVQSPKVQKLGKGHQSLKNNPNAGKSSEDDKDQIIKATTKLKKESFDPYDIVMNYLLEMGHVNNVDEANYVMMEMDKETLDKILNDQQR